MRPDGHGREILIKCFLDMRSKFESKGIEPLGEVANILQKVIVEDHRWNGGEKTGGGGDERFGDAWRDSAQTGGTSAAQAGERVDDAPHGSKQADEGRPGPGFSHPVHAFFATPHPIARPSFPSSR